MERKPMTFSEYQRSMVWKMDRYQKAKAIGQAIVLFMAGHSALNALLYHIGF